MGNIKEIIKAEIQSETDYINVWDEERIQEIIDEKLLHYPEYISVAEKLRLRKEIYNSLTRLDMLSELLEDEETSEIMINGTNDIYVEKRGIIEKYCYSFDKVEKLEDIIQQIVSGHNRIVNESSPIVDVRLADGSRVNIVLPPIAINGPIVTIRKFPKFDYTLERLIENGTVTEEVGSFLKDIVCAKYNIFISGGTGCGKTTFLNALSNYIPADERVITIEDSAELKIQGIGNLVRLETRNANLEGRNEITIRDLIKSSLRMRPDRIIVGEVRGGEALDMLQAMNTGHDGSLCTGHANSTVDMISRLEMLVLIGKELPLPAIKRQIASALDIIIHISRMRDKSRKVVDISEVLFDGNDVCLNQLYAYEDGGLVRTDNDMINMSKLNMSKA